MLKRSLILVVALLFVVGLTAQLAPRASAMPSTTGTLPCGMFVLPTAASNGGSEMPGTPCKGMLSPCLAGMGCAVAVDLPRQLSAPVPVEWAPIRYTASTAALDGLAVEPELSPPIFSL